MPQNSERNKLVENNIGLVGKVIKDRVHNINGIGIFTYDDLFQIGCIGLMNAADTYRPGEACFSTYAYRLIRNEIFDALEYASVRRNRETVTDPAWLSQDVSERFPDTPARDLMQMLDDAQAGTSGITAKGIAAIRLLAAGYTHREIGERLGAAANNVSAWVSRARKYLRSRPEFAALGEN